MTSIRPKKHLGQHFLRDEHIASKIANALNPGHNLVIEVGPGTGVLTKHLLSDNFLAFDLDEASISYLKKTYPEFKDQFIFQDFLHYDFPSFPVSIIGNFPYNISSQLLFQIYDHRDKVEEVVCMLQKEVADRIASRHGSKVYGILSVLMQAFYEVEYLFSVPPEVFNPPPKVQSAVIRLKRNATKQLPCDEALFKTVVKTGFGKRRKTLRNALKGLILPKVTLEGEWLGKRAEQLSVQDFIYITKEISAYGSNSV